MAPKVPARKAQATDAQPESLGKGSLVVQVIAPRFAQDSEFLVYCHLRAPKERWREFPRKRNRKQIPDIINEREDDRLTLKFTRLRLNVGSPIVMQSIEAGKYDLRAQAWPMGLISQLTEKTIVIKHNETTVITLWVHSFTPVGAKNADLKINIKRFTGVAASPNMLLETAKKQADSLEKGKKKGCFGCF